MGGETLDARLEPIAQALILIIILIAVAAVSFLIINKMAIRRRERTHGKLSASRRTKHTQVNLLGDSNAEEREPKTYSSKHSRRRRASSPNAMIDILARREDSSEAEPSPEKRGS